jgi:hypothetical protein
MTSKANAAHAWLRNRSVDWWPETRMISPMRLARTATAFLNTHINPQPDRLVELTSALLVAYTGSTAIIQTVSFIAPHLRPSGALHSLRL